MSSSVQECQLRGGATRPVLFVRAGHTRLTDPVRERQSVVHADCLCD